MKTVIIGGTFNPIHNGHLYVSEELKIQLGYERVLFIPSNYQAHKSTSELVPTNNRIDMLELALSGSDTIVDLCEIERGGLSYMIDTVNTVRKKYNISGRIGLFIGDDLIKGMKGWHNIQELLDSVAVIVAHRESELEFSTVIPHSYMDNVSINISSSDIRNRIRKGKAFRYLIPELVYSYILEKDLYKKDVS